MANKRVFYAIQQVGFAKDGTTTYVEGHGVQSVGITTNFNLEQIFELGQLSIYDVVEGVPDIEVTMEKVLDGYPLLYHLATNGSSSATLIGRSTVSTIVGLSVFADTSLSATGTPIAEVSMSGMVVSSLTYAAPVEGNVTESISLVGFNKVWLDDETSPGSAVFTGRFNNSDAPMAITGSGGVQRRQNVIMVPLSGSPTGVDVNGATNAYCSVWPTELPGITSSGTNPLQADGTYLCPIQNITINCDLGRTQILELGIKSPYFRYVNFPVEVRTDIEILDRKWDNVSATEAGGNNGATAPNNTKFQTIKLRMQEGTVIDCGTRNRLSSVSTSGGDAGGGGGNVTMRYSYITYNDLTISHPADPSGL